jgi:hypothetical protein
MAKRNLPLRADSDRSAGKGKHWSDFRLKSTNFGTFRISSSGQGQKIFNIKKTRDKETIK